MWRDSSKWVRAPQERHFVLPLRIQLKRLAELTTGSNLQGVDWSLLADKVDREGPPSAKSGPPNRRQSWQDQMT